MQRLFEPIAIARGLSASQRLLLRGMLFMTGMMVLGLALGSVSRFAGTDALTQIRGLEQANTAFQGELETLRLENSRAAALLDYSRRYQIPADLAELIHTTALREGIEPEVAFRLIQVESGFNPRAVSPAGALGLTQLMQATARFYEPNITAQELMDPGTNVRIGLRYLSYLLARYDGNAELALLAYNRGPSRLAQLLGGGQDPRNGYASTVMSGY